jgi:hypothetical protein
MGYIIKRKNSLRRQRCNAPKPKNKNDFLVFYTVLCEQVKTHFQNAALHLLGRFCGRGRRSLKALQRT